MNESGRLLLKWKVIALLDRIKVLRIKLGLSVLGTYLALIVFSGYAKQHFDSWLKVKTQFPLV